MIAFLKYNSLTKLTNLFRNEIERKFLRIELSSKPYLVNSEPTNYCNYRCLFCPTGKGSGRQGGFADVRLYQKLLEQLGNYLYLITIHGWGEPLMHKKLPEIIKLAHCRKIFTVVTTNGYFLTRELSRELILSRLDYLILSVDGAIDETYRKYRIGGQFETVLSNIREIVDLKKELKSSTPFVELQFLVFRHNEHEMKAAVDLADDVGTDNILFMPAYTEDDRYNSSDNKYHLGRFFPLSKRTDCRHLWSTLSFHWNGNIVPCCYDYKGDVSPGSIVNEDFDQIRNKSVFRVSRQIIKSRSTAYIKNLACTHYVEHLQVR
jgi:pyruvate-formate lyase-activating enzyme